MLQRHPLLLAEWLAARNLLARARAHALKVIAAGGAALGAAAVLLVTLRSQLPAVFPWLLAYRVLMLVAVGAYALFAVGRQRRRAEVRYTQFWLAAAPVRQYSRTLAILVVSMLPLVAQLLAVCVLLAAMGLVADVAALAVGESMLWIAGGAQSLARRLGGGPRGARVPTRWKVRATCVRSKRARTPCLPPLLSRAGRWRRFVPGADRTICESC